MSKHIYAQRTRHRVGAHVAGYGRCGPFYRADQPCHSASAARVPTGDTAGDTWSREMSERNSDATNSRNRANAATTRRMKWGKENQRTSR
jgi:hypothetical protein